METPTLPADLDAFYASVEQFRDERYTASMRSITTLFALVREIPYASEQGILRAEQGIKSQRIREFSNQIRES